MARAWDARRTILVMHDAHLTALSLPAGAHLRRSVWPAAGLCVAAHLPKGSLQALLPAQSTRPQTRSPRPARRAWPPRTPSSRSRSMNDCTSRRRRQSGRSCHHSGAFVAVGGSRAARSGLGHCGTLPPFWWVRASALPPSVAGSAAPSPWARSTRGCRRACRACRRGCRVSAASSPSATSSWGRCCSVTMAQASPPSWREAKELPRPAVFL